MAQPITYSRSFIVASLVEQGSMTYDFAFGEYLATKSFFEELTEVQNKILAKEKFTLSTGQEIDPSSPGGMIAIQLFMELLDSRRLAATGLAKAGLNAEKQTWKNL
jgi:hypothetical protein